MSEEKQYILRKPISLNEIGTANNILKYLVEFDEELLHQQLMQDKELFHLASLIGCEPEHEERRREKLADYVLGLIKGEQS